MEKIEGMNAEILWFVVTIAGVIIAGLFGVVMYFGKRLITEFRISMTEMKNDIKGNTEETGRNKGRIELVELQQQADTKRIEEMTQQKLIFMAEKIEDLTSTVKLAMFGKGWYTIRIHYCWCKLVE